jgi:tetratricopeptide (TPR) repeat protein
MPELHALRGASWEQMLSLAPPDTVQRAVRTRLPGMALVSVVRAALAQRGALQDAAAVSVWLSAQLDARLGAAHPDALAERAAAGGWLFRAGDRAGADAMLSSAWSGLRQAGISDARLAAVGERWSAVLMAEERYDTAEEVLEVVWRLRRREGRGAPISARLGQVRLARGDVAAALPLLREAWGESDGRPWRLGVGRTLGLALVRHELFEEAVPILRTVVDAEHDDGSRAEACMALGTALEGLRSLPEALRMVEEGVKLTRAQEADRAVLAQRLSIASRMAFARGRVHDAEGLLKEAVDLDRQHYGDDTPEVARRYSELGRMVLALGRTEEALGGLEPATSLLRRHLGEEAELTRRAAEAQAAGLIANADQANGGGDRELASYYIERVLALRTMLDDHDSALLRARMFR